LAANNVSQVAGFTILIAGIGCAYSTGYPLGDRKMRMRQIYNKTTTRLTLTSVLFGGFATVASACSYSGSGISVYGERGGFTFYNGLLVQINRQTGKKLTANQAITVSSVAACAQVCLADRNCTGVSYRATASKQCLTFAGHDFETNSAMDLGLYSGGGIKYLSAVIRSGYQGSVCR